MSLGHKGTRGLIAVLALALALSSGLGTALAAPDDNVMTAPPTLETLTIFLTEHYAQGSLTKMQFAPFMARIQEMQGALNLADTSLAKRIADAFVVEILAEVDRGLGADLAETIQDQIRQIAGLWE